MDLATMIGIVGAIGFIVMAMIMGGGLGMFIDIPSIAIVFGGSTFVLLSNYTLPQFISAGKIVAKAFSFKIETPVSSLYFLALNRYKRATSNLL